MADLRGGAIAIWMRTMPDVQPSSGAQQYFFATFHVIFAHKTNKRVLCFSENDKKSLNL